MNFLNKERTENRWLGIVLGIVYALSYIFANVGSAEMLMRSMGMMFGIEVTGGYYAMVLIASAGISFLFFILFISMAYSMAYRSLVNKTRDLKVMPVSKDSFVNHVEFVMIFANLIIGAIAILMKYFPLYQGVVDILVRFIVRVAGYLLVLWLLSRVGVGDNVKKKLFGGFLTPLAVVIVILL